MKRKNNFENYNKNITKIVANISQEAVSNSAIKLLQKAKSVILIGVGTSYNAALTVCSILKDYINKPIYVEYTNSFIKQKQIILDATYIVISQSGESILAIEAVKKIKDQQGTIIGISEDPNSTMGKITDSCIRMHDFHEMATFKSIGFISTIIKVLYMFNIKAEKQVAKASIMLNKQNMVIDKMINKLRKGITKETSITFLGELESFGLANEFALKVIEMGWIKGLAFELEDFIHGKDGYVGLNDIYFIIDHLHQNKKITSKYLEVLKDKGAKLVYVSNSNMQLKYVDDRITNMFFNIFVFYKINLMINVVLKRDKYNLRFRDLVKITKTYN